MQTDMLIKAITQHIPAGDRKGARVKVRAYTKPQEQIIVPFDYNSEDINFSHHKNALLKLFPDAQIADYKERPRGYTIWFTIEDPIFATVLAELRKGEEK